MAEMILRCLPVDSGLQMQATDDQHPFMRAHPKQQYTYSYGWSFSNARQGQTNSSGISNSRDWDAEKPAVLVMGDSYVESAMLDYQDSLQGQLEQAKIDAAVFAMSYSGANAADYLQMMSYAAKHLHLRALVLPIANNDFLESVPSIHQPEPGHGWFETVDGRMELGFKSYSPSKIKEWARQFAIARYLQRNLKFNPIQGIKNELNQSGKTMAEGASKTANNINSKDFRPYINYFLHELPVRSGVPISATVFVIDCHRKSLYKKWLLPSITEESRDGIMDVFVDSARQQGATVIEMCPAMEAYVKHSKQRLDFSPEDSHWNPTGHALVANEVIPVLKRIF